MTRKTVSLLPSAQRVLKLLALNIKAARLRRELSAEIVAERAGISRATLGSIEAGSPSVSMGAWVQVLFVLGLEKDLAQVASDDTLGRTLQDARLPVRARARKKPDSAGNAHA